MLERKENLVNQRIRPELLAQRAAVDAEYAGCLALIAVCVIHYRFEQRPFYFADHEVIKIAGAVAIQIGEILIECIFGVLVKRFLALVDLERVAVLIVNLVHVDQVLLRLRCQRNTSLIAIEVFPGQVDLFTCVFDAHYPVTKIVCIYETIAIPGQMLPCHPNTR